MPATHPMLAKVVDNNDPHGIGRIKAEFIGWGGEGKQTDWLRVLTPDAGGGGEKVAKNRGLVTVPEKNDQVYVDFENGNPDKPFVTGSVFHGKHGGGGGTGNNSKSLTSKSGHTVMLDDGGGITIKDKSGTDTILLDGTNAITITAGQTITLLSGKSGLIIDGASNTIMLSAEHIAISGSTDAMIYAGESTGFSAESGGKVDMMGKEATLTGTLTAVVTGADTTVNGDTKAGIKSSGPTSVEGAIVKLN
jgi:uncharacterized protein involved in type VI secretion and phage assembly